MCLLLWLKEGSVGIQAGGTEGNCSLLTQGPAPSISCCRWKFWRLGVCKAVVPLQAAWTAFCQPVPASCKELLIQLLLCVSLASVVAGLVHHRLLSLQLYPLGPPASVTAVCGVLVFLILGLVPPIRCLFALSVPTLGSQQGRRLLLSYSAANLAVAVVPNVLANVQAAGRVLSCVTQGSLESLLNTTHQLHQAARELGPAGQEVSRSLAFETEGNGSAFRLHTLRVTQQILEDFSGLEVLAQAALGTQRVITGLFMLGLLGEAAWYLHCYLTNLRFDNIYATRQLVQQLAQAGATHLLASPPPWLLQTAQPKLSQEELLSCLLRLGLLALFLVATAVTVAADYGAFLLAQAAVAWAQKLPTVPIILTVKYNVSARRGMLLEHSDERGLDSLASESSSLNAPRSLTDRWLGGLGGQETEMEYTKRPGLGTAPRLPPSNKAFVL